MFRVYKALRGPTMFPDIFWIERFSMRFAGFLLENARVLAAPGVFYIGEGHVRTTFWGSGSVLTEEYMHEAGERIKEACTAIFILQATDSIVPMISPS